MPQPTRRSPGEGSITQRPSGLWQARLQIGGVRQTVYGRTRSDVAGKLRELTQTANTAGRLPTNTKQTLAEYLSDWLTQAEARLRPTTLADYQTMVCKHIVPTLGPTRLARLTPLQLAKYQTTLARTLSPRRVRMVHDLLHKVLGDACRWGLVASNPVALVEAPQREDVERVMWSPEEVQAFTVALVNGDPGQYGPVLLFLLASGCRIGEALGLRWSDFDDRAGSVSIQRQVVQLGQVFHEGAPKTRHGVRVVALPDFGVRALQQQRARNAENRLRLGARWRDASGRVFLTQTGTTPERGNIKRALHAVCDRLGLPRISPHGLRHLHLSLLAMNGVPLKVAQQRAGHSTPVITARVYQHVLGDADKEAAEAIGRALAIEA